MPGMISKRKTAEMNLSTFSMIFSDHIIATPSASIFCECGSLTDVHIVMARPRFRQRIGPSTIDLSHFLYLNATVPQYSLRTAKSRNNRPVLSLGRKNNGRARDTLHALV